MQLEAIWPHANEVQEFMAWTFTQVFERVRKYGGPIVTVIAIFAALFGGVKYIIGSEVAGMRSDIGTLKTDVSSLHGDVGKANARIDDLLAKALDRAFPAPDADKKKIRGSLDDMKGILQLAKDQNIQLNPQLLATYGQQISEISSDPDTTDKAWNMLGSLLDYRSSLNAKDSPTAHESFINLPQGSELLAYANVRGRGKNGTATITFSNRLVPANQSFIRDR